MFAWFLLLAAASALAADAPDSSSIQQRWLSERLVLFTTDQGAYTTNSLAFVGPDGLLLVDTQGPPDTTAFRRAVEGLGFGPPKIIVNTHAHGEHIGGNGLWGLTPEVVAHEKQVAKFTTGLALFAEIPATARPDRTVADSLTIEFNGERIRLLALGGSHDVNELAVHFVDQGVVHLSSIVNGFTFPSLDADGDARMFAPLVERALEWLPGEIVVVSGHGGTGGRADLVAYREMLLETESLVDEALDFGLGIEDLEEEGLLDDLSELPVSYVGLGEWLDALFVAAISDRPVGAPRRPGPYGPMHAAWVEGGSAAAVQDYRALVAEFEREGRSQYDLSELDLLMVGLTLRGRGLDEDALPFLQAFLDDRPGHAYGYYASHEIALAQQALGRPAEALAACRRTLELKPDFEEGRALLEELD